VAHPEQRAFITVALGKILDDAPLRRVIEIGSFDVNGEIRSLFEQSSLEQYVGVDLVEGPGVDVVDFGHELVMAPGSFDLAISVECFEHDRFWQRTFDKMTELIRPGGWLVFTCAGPGRPEHGTSRSDPRLSPGTSSRGLDYYRNLTREDFTGLGELGDRFQRFQFITNPNVFDLYFIGQKAREGERGAPSFLIDGVETRRIIAVTSTAHRLVRWPLRALYRILPEKSYQEIAYRYWKVLNSLQERYLGSRFSRS
jgi:SAM-dependent methyltransferase